MTFSTFYQSFDNSNKLIQRTRGIRIDENQIILFNYYPIYPII